MTPFESAPALPEHTEDARALRMHLERALTCLAAGDVDGARAAASMASAAPSSAVQHELIVERDGRGYRMHGRAVSLQRRGNLRRILLALVERRLSSPGAAITREQVLAIGWPDERMRSESGALRVYTAIRRLRQGGLGTVIVTTDDGYLIDPGVTVGVIGR